MELVLYGDDDLGLTEAIETDPAVMKELGGPVAREKIPAIHRRRVEAVAKGAWWFKIVPEPAGGAAGTVGIWEHEWRGERVHEMGWMVLPAFQRRGLAGAAASLLLERARAEGRFKTIVAFPAVANAASNAICRKLGFSRLEDFDYDYQGRPLRCAHWRLALT